MKHEDDRRVLFDLDQESQTTKIVVCKKDCVLGNPYHKKKTETFMLISGFGIVNRDGYIQEMEIGEKYTVTPNVRHEFKLNEGAVLACLVDRRYDPNDDYYV